MYGIVVIGSTTITDLLGTVNYNENNIPFINRGNRLAVGAMGIKYTDRQYGTPLEPIIEHEKSYSTLRASISTAPSLRKIVNNSTPNSASIMQENERIAMSAISCVPKGRERACGGDAAGGPIQQPATRQGHVTGDREGHAMQIAQTVAVGIAAHCQTAEDRKEKQAITIKSCADDRQSGEFSLVSDCRAKSSRCKPSVRYRLCPPSENHKCVRDQLKVPLKQVENEVQLNDDCNATMDSREHPLKTEKITTISAVGSRKRPRRIYLKYRLMRCKRSQDSRTILHCFA